MPHRLVIDTCHTYINCKFNNKLPNAAYTSSKIMLKIINSRHKPPHSSPLDKILCKPLNASKNRKIEKNIEFFWYNAKNNYLCVFIWQKALKKNEIT